MSSFQKLPPAEKTLYLGRSRKGLAGGKVDVDDEGDDLDADEDVAMPQSSAASDQIPIFYQCLPVVVLLDLIVAYWGKHVIDLAPSPLGLAGDW